MSCELHKYASHLLSWLQAAEQDARAGLRAAHAQADSATEELHSARATAATAQAEAASLRSELAAATAAAADGASAVRTVHGLLGLCRLSQHGSMTVHALAHRINADGKHCTQASGLRTSTSAVVQTRQ